MRDLPHIHLILSPWLLLFLLKLRFFRRTLSSGSLAGFSDGFGFSSVVVSVSLVRLLLPKVAIIQSAQTECRKLNISSHITNSGLIDKTAVTLFFYFILDVAFKPVSCLGAASALLLRWLLFWSTLEITKFFCNAEDNPNDSPFPAWSNLNHRHC